MKGDGIWAEENRVGSAVGQREKWCRGREIESSFLSTSLTEFSKLGFLTTRILGV